jgi:LysR family cyn operon transcriptional activator
VEIRHLRYFLAVAEELNFTRAAGLLYISQPTLSQQIRALEKAVGGPLFHRDPGGLRLTAAGHALLEPARYALAAVADGLQAARDAGRLDSGVLRVGLLCGAAGELTEPILAAFATAFPQVQLRFRELDMGSLYNGLLDDGIDVAFTRLPLDPERHAWTILFAEPRLLGVGAGHHLADAVTVTLDDILALPMPTCPLQQDAPDAYRYWMLNQYRNDYPPRHAGNPVATPLETAHELVRHPPLVVVGPELFRRVPPLPSQVLRMINLQGISTTHVVAARRRRDRRPTVVAFCQIAGTTAHHLAPLVLPEGTLHITPTPPTRQPPTVASLAA